MSDFNLTFELNTYSHVATDLDRDCQPTRCRGSRLPSAEVWSKQHIDNFVLHFPVNKILSPHFSNEIRQKCSRSLKSEVGKLVVGLQADTWNDPISVHVTDPTLESPSRVTNQKGFYKWMLGSADRKEFTSPSEGKGNNVILYHKLSKMRFH